MQKAILTITIQILMLPVPPAPAGGYFIISNIVRKAPAMLDRCFRCLKAYFAVFKMSRNSFAVTMNGFAGKCFILPVTRYASSSCFSTTTS